MCQLRWQNLLEYITLSTCFSVITLIRQRTPCLYCRWFGAGLHVVCYFQVIRLLIYLYRSIKYPVREVDFDRYCDRLIFIGGTWNNFVDVNVLLVTYGPTFLGILLLLHKLFTSCSYCFAAKQNPQNVLFALGIQFPFQESTANVG